MGKPGTGDGARRTSEFRAKRGKGGILRLHPPAHSTVLVISPTLRATSSAESRTLAAAERSAQRPADNKDLVLDISGFDVLLERKRRGALRAAHRGRRRSLGCRVRCTRFGVRSRAITSSDLASLRRT